MWTGLEEGNTWRWLAVQIRKINWKRLKGYKHTKTVTKYQALQGKQYANDLQQTENIKRVDISNKIDQYLPVLYKDFMLILCRIFMASNNSNYNISMIINQISYGVILLKRLQDMSLGQNI
jgi:hypothetical protein